jgi:hypothetical protein
VKVAVIGGFAGAQGLARARVPDLAGLDGVGAGHPARGAKKNRWMNQRLQKEICFF